MAFMGSRHHPKLVATSMRGSLCLTLMLPLITTTCAKKRSPPEVDDGNTTTGETYTQTGPNSGSTLSLLAQQIINDLVTAIGPSAPNAGANNLSDTQASAIGNAAT